MTLQETYSQIDQLKNELDALRPLTPEVERKIMDKFRLDWNYHSSNIEGNSLTYGETKALLLFGITASGKPFKDHLEIQGHDEAVKWVDEILKQKRPLTENFIRELHKVILKEAYEVDAITPDGKPTKKLIQIGDYKKTPNHVLTKTGEIFRFAEPEETPAMVNDLMEFYKVHTASTETNFVWLAAMFHYKFIRIHPFDDGNGRIARILMNFILMQHGFPPVIIKTNDKPQYIAALQKADVGDLESFVAYIGEQLIQSLELMIKGAKGESIEDTEDLDKKIALLKNKIDNIKTVENVEVEKSSLVIHKLCEDSLKPLFNLGIETANKFSEFYASTKHQVFVGGMSSGDTLEKNYQKLTTELLADRDIRGLKLNIKMGGFKKAGTSTVNDNVFIEVMFHQFVYEIIVPTAKSPYTNFTLKKLYNSELSDEERKYIAGKLGDVLLHKVERNLKRIQESK